MTIELIYHRMLQDLCSENSVRWTLRVLWTLLSPLYIAVIYTEKFVFHSAPSFITENHFVEFW